MVRRLRASGRRSTKEKEEDRTENRIEGEERRGREGRGDNDDDDDDKKEHFVILRSK